MSNAVTYKVLLADDDEINRLIVASILTEERGYKVTAATNGRDALMACLTEAFDLLIIDYKMPDIPGDRLIRNVRASANPNANTPVVLFSAATRQELAPVLNSCAIDLHVSKPIAAQDFLQSIGDLLSAIARGAASAGPRPVM